MRTAERVSASSISRDEILERINEAAKNRLHISGDELIRQYCTTGVPDPGPVAEVLILLDLLDPSDPIFAEHTHGQRACAAR